MLFNNCGENFLAEEKADIPIISNYFATTNFTIENSQLSATQLLTETDLKKDVDLRLKKAEVLTNR